MKIIHCADIHLDSNMTANMNIQQAKSRNVELLETFEEMVRFGEQEQVKVILIAGDLFDTQEPTTYVKHVFLEIVKGHPGIQFFYCRGNHDRFVNWEKENIPSNFIFFQREWSSYKLGQVTISGVECMGDSLLEMNEHWGLPEETTNIVMLHGSVVEQVNPKWKEDQIPLDKFRNKYIDYLALGHIHSYQKEHLDQRGIYCYSGCLEGRGFDECGQKGFVLLDVDEGKHTLRSRFIPFGKRQLYEIHVSVEGCMTSAEMARRIENSLDIYGVEKEDFVKILLTGAIDVECEKNMQYIQAKFLDRYFCFRLEDCTTLAVDYSDFIIDETLKGEFVRMIQEADIPQKDKAEIIRFGILALTGEELAE